MTGMLAEFGRDPDPRADKGRHGGVAKRLGVTLGRPRRLSAQQLAHAREPIAQGVKTNIAALLRVSVLTPRWGLEEKSGVPG